MIRTFIVAALAGAASVSQAQDIGRRVAAAPDGTVRLEFASRDGVCGDGRSNISTRNDRRSQDVESECTRGPVMLAVTKEHGAITELRTYVGAKWKQPTAGVTMLGTVGAPAAAAWLLDVASSGATRVASSAIFAATLADSVTVWPQLLKLARDDQRPREARNQAVFWLGQQAAEEVTKGLVDLVADEGDREVRRQAVFALSQQKDKGIDALLQIARTNKDKEIRRQAIFWLGQSRDPRAIDYFEKVLAKQE